MPANLPDLKLTADWQRRIQQDNPGISSVLEIEMIAFRWGTEYGRFYHMKRLANFLFTKEHNPEITKPLDWNPWTTKICKLLCDGDPSMNFRGYPTYLGITGPASSSKTYSVSLYCFLMWFSSPMRTKVVVSSTSIQSAKNRIWADVVHFAKSVPASLRYYDVVTSNPAMVKLPKNMGGTSRDSIELIAGEESQREASEKVLGIKNDLFILAVDEATEVSHALFEARNNLDKNPRFQLIFMGNAKSHDDPHGKVCEPLKGWESINVESELWQTTLPRGMAVHLDGLKSPNMVVADGEEPPFPRLFSRKDLVSVESVEGGQSSPGFVRFGRGFWPKGGTANQIYTQQDIELNGGCEKAIWLEPPVRILGHDPSFVSDGDKSMAVVCEFGLNIERIQTFNHVASETVEVNDSEPAVRSRAMAKALKVIADKYGVSADNIGVDNTGTGVSYPEFIDEEMSGRCYRVPFNGEVSALLYPGDALCPAGDMFDRRVSEIWYIAKLYLTKGQLRGIKKSLIAEMIKRNYDRNKEKKISVERKRDMRARGVSSPDEADAYFIALDLARTKYGFEVYSGKVIAQTMAFPTVKRTFRDWVKKLAPNAQYVMQTPKGGWGSKVIVRK